MPPGTSQDVEGGLVDEGPSISWDFPVFVLMLPETFLDLHGPPELGEKGLKDGPERGSGALFAGACAPGASSLSARASQEFLEKKSPRHGEEGIGLVAPRPRVPVALTLVKPSSSTAKKPLKLSRRSSMALIAVRPCLFLQSRETCPASLHSQHLRSLTATAGRGHLSAACSSPQFGHRLLRAGGAGAERGRAGPPLLGPWVRWAGRPRSRRFQR